MGSEKGEACSLGGPGMSRHSATHQARRIARVVFGSHIREFSVSEWFSVGAGKWLPTRANRPSNLVCAAVFSSLPGSSDADLLLVGMAIIAVLQAAYGLPL